jgi:aminoglycoside phosphotransferase
MAAAAAEPGGRFTAAQTRRRLAELCAEAGLDDTGAVAVKLTVNAVYRLPCEGVVVRIASSAAMTHRIAKVVRIARWFETHDLPAVRLAPDVPAPLRAGTAVATVWLDEGEHDPSPTVADLAGLLRQLHRLPPPTESPLPAWAPFDDVRRRLSDAEAIDPADLAFLRELAASVEADLDQVRFALPPVVVHGDAHLGNVVRTADGRVVLCDFDATCFGPAEWDLVPVAVGRIRFGHPPQWHDDLAAAYGFDVTDSPAFGVLRAVRELKLVTSVVPVLGSNPAAAAQFRVRLGSLRSGDPSVVWSRYR